MRNTALALMLMMTCIGPAAAQGAVSEDSMASRWLADLMSQNGSGHGLAFTKDAPPKIKAAIVAVETSPTADAASQAGYERAYAAVQTFISANPSGTPLALACTNARNNVADEFHLDLPKKPF